MFWGEAWLRSRSVSGLGGDSGCPRLLGPILRESGAKLLLNGWSSIWVGVSLSLREGEIHCWESCLAEAEDDAPGSATTDLIRAKSTGSSIFDMDLFEVQSVCAVSLGPTRPVAGEAASC